MKKENMNNKGFSLVELIIVIAIMAILIVVLAPQYLKYVERSRNSTDLQNARTLMTAVETYAADPQATKAFLKDEKVEIKVTNASASLTSDSADGAGAQGIADAGLTLADIKCSSKTKWKEYTLIGTMQANGAIKWTFSSDPANAFANAMAGKS